MTRMTAEQRIALLTAKRLAEAITQVVNETPEGARAGYRRLLGFRLLIVGLDRSPPCQAGQGLAARRSARTSHASA
jgi:hypothetical protein